MTKLRTRLGFLTATAVVAGVLAGLPSANAAGLYPALSLPFAGGQQVYSAGIHSDDGSTGVKNAIDFSPADKTVRAAFAGTVRLQHCAGGDWVTIDHVNGWRTGYYHMEGIVVTDGEAVEAGTVLGKTGNALPCGGSSTGAHVHFTLWTLPDAPGTPTASNAPGVAARNSAAAGNWDGLSYQQVAGDVAQAYGEPIDGKTLGEWTFTEGAQQYSGTATHATDNSVVRLPGRFRVAR